MEAVVVQKGRAMDQGGPTMPTVSSAPQATQFMVLIKGIAGFAILALCLAGAGAALMKLQFGPAAQLIATAVGALGGATLVWQTRFSTAKE